MESAGEHVVLTGDQGTAMWFLNTLTITKVASADTGGRLSILDHRCPAGFAPPPHIHRESDEAFYVLEGWFEGFCGEQSWKAGPDTLVFLPRGIPHGFRVAEAEPGRLLLILAPGGFDRFVADLGEPAGQLVLPEPAVPDPVRVAEIAAAHGIHLIPPPSPPSTAVL
jgi:quercetin dioxygenase-like cupin family protein